LRQQLTDDGRILSIPYQLSGTYIVLVMFSHVIQSCDRCEHVSCAKRLCKSSWCLVCRSWYGWRSAVHSGTTSTTSATDTNTSTAALRWADCSTLHSDSTNVSFVLSRCA